MAKTEKMTSCLSCKHLRTRKSNMGNNIPSGTCDAFPDGIPLDIQFGSTVHDVPYNRDNGIVYERKVINKKIPYIRKD